MSENLKPAIRNPISATNLHHESNEFPPQVGIDYQGFKFYENVHSGDRVCVLNNDDVMITVKYLHNKRKTTYRTKYFDRHFNPVRDE